LLLKGINFLLIAHIGEIKARIKRLKKVSYFFVKSDWIDNGIDNLHKPKLRYLCTKNICSTWKSFSSICHPNYKAKGITDLTQCVYKLTVTDDHAMDATVELGKK
jgi:glycerol-3-phosphate responsive antiterminator